MTATVWLLVGLLSLNGEHMAGPAQWYKTEAECKKAGESAKVSVQAQFPKTRIQLKCVEFQGEGV